jgi:hypothetical protein
MTRAGDHPTSLGPGGEHQAEIRTAALDDASPVFSGVVGERTALDYGLRAHGRMAASPNPSAAVFASKTHLRMVGKW